MRLSRYRRLSTNGSALTSVLATSSESSIKLNTGELVTSYSQANDPTVLFGQQADDIFDLRFNEQHNLIHLPLYSSIKLGVAIEPGHYSLQVI